MIEKAAIAGWTVVAGAGTLAPRQRIRVAFAGEELVLWRGASGRLSAWANRCPHRGMRLSFGFVRGDELHCLYHGWRYGADGVCVGIPAHPDLVPPPTIRARAHRVAERDGLVFVAADAEHPMPLPVLGRVSAVGFRFARSVHIRAPAWEVRAALAAAAPFDLDVAGRHPLAAPGEEREDEVIVYRGAGMAAACAVQAVSGEETAVHGAVDGPQPDDPLALAVWLAAFRDGLEATVPVEEIGA